MLDERDIEALTRCSEWSSLSQLDLSSNKFGDKGLRSLCSDIIWKSLKVLIFSHNTMCDEACQRFLKRKWAELEAIYLSRNSLEDSGAYAMASNTVWTNLKKLILTINGIGVIDCTAIGRMIFGKSQRFEFHHSTELETKELLPLQITVVRKS